MNDDQKSELSSASQNNLPEVSISQEVIDFVAGVEIPEPIKRTLADALSRLMIGLVDVPVAYLESKSREIREATEARAEILKTTGQGIRNHLSVAPEVADRAVEQYVKKILREKENVSKVGKYAIEELKKSPKSKFRETDEIIDQDWLNAFETEACQKSSEEMRYLFGRILAGKVCTPSQFSTRTVKLVSQIDSTTASLFCRLASMAVCLKSGETIFDCRIIDLSGAAAQKGFPEFGISYPDLLLLSECGLIAYEFKTQMNYTPCVANEGKVIAGFEYNQTLFALVAEPNQPRPDPLMLSGVILTNVGRELLSVIDLQANEAYTSALSDYFKRYKLAMVEM